MRAERWMQYLINHDTPNNIAILFTDPPTNNLSSSFETKLGHTTLVQAQNVDHKAIETSIRRCRIPITRDTREL